MTKNFRKKVAGKKYNIDIKMLNKAIQEYYNPTPTAIKYENKIKINPNYIPAPEEESQMQPQDQVDVKISKKFSDESNPKNEEIDLKTLD